MRREVFSQGPFRYVYVSGVLMGLLLHLAWTQLQVLYLDQFEAPTVGAIVKQSIEMNDPVVWLCGAGLGMVFLLWATPNIKEEFVTIPGKFLFEVFWPGEQRIDEKEDDD